MSDERDQQGNEVPAEPERDGSGFRQDGVIEYGIDDQGFLHVDGTQIEKVAEEPGEQIPGQIQIGGRNYTQDELEAAIQRATEAEQKIAEVEKIKENLEPYERIINDESFRTYLQERVDSGEEGPSFPVPQPEDTGGYHKRLERPGSADVYEAIIRYATSAPEYEQEALDNNAAYFNQVFDRIEKSLGDLEGRPSLRELQRQASRPPDNIISQILKSKEVSKGRAIVERPGVSPPPDAGLNRSRREMERIVEYAKRGDEESQLKWAEMLIEGPRKKGPPESGF